MNQYVIVDRGISAIAALFTSSPDRSKDAPDAALQDMALVEYLIVQMSLENSRNLRA